MANNFTPGWNRQPKDERDFLHSHVERFVGKSLPSSKKLYTLFVYDQKNLGSCTANASGLCFALKTPQPTANQIYLGQAKAFIPSRLYTYFQTRELEGNVMEDTGGFIRDAFRSIAKGVPNESVWPYDIRKFNMNLPSQALDNAKYHRALRYAAIPKNLQAIRSVLQTSAITIGFDVFESFEYTPVFKNLRMPKPSGQILGGHAVAVIGYDDKKKCVLVQNSWGKKWQNGGQFWMPYDFLLSQHADDFWAFEEIEFIERDGDMVSIPKEIVR